MPRHSRFRTLRIHGADNLALSLDTRLAIVEAAHGHTADAPTLDRAGAADASSRCTHYADVVVLGFPSAPGLGPTVEEIVAAVLAALQATTIPVDMKKNQMEFTIGTGSGLSPWRPA